MSVWYFQLLLKKSIGVYTSAPFFVVDAATVVYMLVFMMILVVFRWVFGWANVCECSDSYRNYFTWRLSALKTSTYHKNYINGYVCVSVKMDTVLGCGYAECKFRECKWQLLGNCIYFYTYVYSMTILKRKRLYIQRFGAYCTDM